MQMKDIIEKKRDGKALTREEIDFFIEGYTKGEIPDYQASALLMAIYFQDLDKEEIFALTDAMRRSGDIMDLSDIPGIKVDKHSTGGVGDKTTLVVAPICASAGVPVAKMSGRGLGFTGGTVDKLESIPGFKTTLSEDEFKRIVKETGICVIGQSEHIAAADKKLYALRDVTATVDNIGLITSSIMSKKLASGADAVVLDVKFGDGAFMKTRENAEVLAQMMVEIGRKAGKRMAAFITDMQQPLGFGIGNSIEVMEAISTLKGEGPLDLTEICVKLAGYMIYVGGKASSPEEGMKIAGDNIKNGKAIEKFVQFVKAQGGNPEIINDERLFPQAGCKMELKAEAEGYVTELEAGEVGRASQMAGAGRKTKGDAVDLAAGIILKKKRGDRACEGEVLAEVYAANEEKAQDAVSILRKAYVITERKPEKEDLIYKIIS